MVPEGEHTRSAWRSWCRRPRTGRCRPRSLPAKPECVAQGDCVLLGQNAVGGDGEMDHRVISLVGDVEICSRRRRPWRPDVPPEETVGAPVRRAPDWESTAKVSICPALPARCRRNWPENIVDGDKLAGSQKSGHEKADGRDQKELAQFAELHSLPSSWAMSASPRKNCLRCPVVIVKACTGCCYGSSRRGTIAGRHCDYSAPCALCGMAATAWAGRWPYREKSAK